MDKRTIKRDGLPPIAFEGEVLAEADNRISDNGNRANRWTEVSIYRTKGGRYVAAVTRRTCWQGESDHREATSCATAPEVIAWLGKEDGTLGTVSQEAVEKAVRVDPAFAAAWVEQVE